MTGPAYMETREERDPPYTPRANERAKSSAPESTCKQTDIGVVCGTHLGQSTKIEPE